MFEQAQDLKKLHEESKKQAQALLKRVIQTNNLGYVLQVYQEVEDLLPTTNWIPDRTEFPLIRDYIDQHDYFRREGTYDFLGMMEEEVWFFVDATEEEQARALANDYGWNPHDSVPLLWEIVKSGYGKFHFDW